jgi:2-polyprenyl-3-methyl-5-hydroxy-6-metoxy-1,4-benzoquinol methylase
MSSELLSADLITPYWEARHRDLDDLRSGGHISLDRASNELFYLMRLGQLISLIGDRTSSDEPLYLLDAGCGKGYFARALDKCGFRVDGIDTSATAIAQCRRTAPHMLYEVAQLSSWHSPYLYDIVYSVDVLFHIVDQGEWEKSLRNLASLVRLRGKLIFTEESGDDGRQLGSYIKHRAQGDYAQVLEDLGLQMDQFLPYGFRESAIGFFVYIRIH